MSMNTSRIFWPMASRIPAGGRAPTCADAGAFFLTALSGLLLLATGCRA